MPFVIEANRAYGNGILVRKGYNGVPVSEQIENLQAALQWLGATPIPIPSPAPITTVDVDTDNDGTPDVRVTVDDIPDDE